MIPEARQALAALADLPQDTILEDYLGAQYDLGLAWPNFRPGRGGLNLSAKQSKDLLAAIRDRGPHQSPASFIGLNQASALIHNAGTRDQQDRYLRRIFTGDDQWCQLFSEPGAGSDLANVSTKAVRHGDGWRVNGQKVWTSNARHSNLGLLLARTDPDAPKHQGLTLFIVDMTTSGVDVRPLRQADGGSRFSEVFFSDVVVGDDRRLGEAGEGWRLAMATLATERGSASDIFVGPMGVLLDQWRATKTKRPASLRDAVTATWIDHFVLNVSRARLLESAEAGSGDALRSISKTTASEHLQRMADVLAEVVGPSVLTMADYAEADGEEALATSAKAKNFSVLTPHRFAIRSLAMSIEGGTNQITRNIIGERTLGLPPEPRLDRDRPWKDIRQS